MDSFWHNIEWRPGIGDPSIGGWLTVAAYFLCAYWSWRVVKHRERIFDAPFARQSLLWMSITGLMIALGINKQLDLQTLFTATARALALAQGWYDERREMQRAFITTVGISGLIAIALLTWAYFKVLARHWLAIVGLCVLIVFVMVRAISFHSVDHWIGVKVMGLYLNWILELGGIAMVALNARRLYAQRKPLINLAEMQARHPPRIHEGQ